MAQIITGHTLYQSGRISEDFPADKDLIQLYWTLMQLSEDGNDIEVADAEQAYVQAEMTGTPTCI